MRVRTERIARAIASALLRIDLPTSELLELADRLQYDNELHQRLAGFLRDMAHAADRAGFSGKERSRSMDPMDSIEESVGDLVELFRRRRLPKVRALTILAEHSRPSNWRPNSRISLRENATELFRIVEDPREVDAIVRRMAKALGYAEDPYLRGLS